MTDVASAGPVLVTMMVIGQRLADQHGSGQSETVTTKSFDGLTLNTLLVPATPLTSNARRTIPVDACKTVTCPLQIPLTKSVTVVGEIDTVVPPGVVNPAREAAPL